MLRLRTLATWLYLTNLALLTVHEIDSAYWHEWRLFRLPGGIQLFLVLNLILLVLMFYGFWQVIEWTRSAKSFSYGLVGLGLFAAAVHGLFIAIGHPEFRSPASLATLIGTLVVSCIQLATVWRCPPAGGAPSAAA